MLGEASSENANTHPVWSVTELNLVIKRKLELDPELVQCHVTGEISNFKHHTSGHMYFTLKDQTSRIRAVMFAGRNRRLRFRPEDGMRVILSGTVSVFERDGQYQLYVDDMQPDGIGALYVQFEQLRNRLQAEGLFDANRKRALPMYPLRIGVVTSATGAVIRDICTTLERRYPLASVILAPAAVQGVDAARTLVRALQQLWQLEKPVDVIIIGRGGGSLEELWPFNEETVARAVAASPIPIVSAVGHETDVTICDYVADVRAATPTAAAELVAPNQRDLAMQLTQSLMRSERAVREQLKMQRMALLRLHKRPVLEHPTRMIALHKQSVDYLEGRLREALTRPVRMAGRRFMDAARRLDRLDLHRRMVRMRYDTDQLARAARQAMREKVNRHDANLHRQIHVLTALNPLHVLKRGYSVAYDNDTKAIVSSVKDLPVGKRIELRVADGSVHAQVMEDGGEVERGRQIRLDI